MMIIPNIGDAEVSEYFDEDFGQKHLIIRPRTQIAKENPAFPEALLTPKARTPSPKSEDSTYVLTTTPAGDVALRATVGIAVPSNLFCFVPAVGW